MKTNREIINEKSIDIFGRNEGVYASESLIEEALEKESELYINLAYTDYGGTLLDKLLITYLTSIKACILVESTSWYGKNAIVFGATAKELKKYIDNGNVLDYMYFDDYYYTKENEQREIAADNYIEENDIPECKRLIVYDYFDNCTVHTFGVDYSETYLQELLNNEE